MIGQWLIEYREWLLSLPFRRVNFLLLLFLVGLSMSLTRAFAGIANRLTAQTIILRIIIDSLVIGILHCTGTILTIVLHEIVIDGNIAITELYGLAPLIIFPGLFYIFSAAPYIGNAIAIFLWATFFLNKIVITQFLFNTTYATAFQVAFPAFLLVLVAVWIQYKDGWRKAYTILSEGTK
jgi:hypothetical protein